MLAIVLVASVIITFFNASLRGLRFRDNHGRLDTL